MHEFLAMIGVPVGPEQEMMLRRELEWFSHPRALVAMRRHEPVDTLIEFLARTERTIPGIAAAELRALLTEDTWASAACSPRTTVVEAVTDWFGRPAAELAAQFGRLIDAHALANRPLDHGTLSHLYPEAEDMCGVWELAMREELVVDLSWAGLADEQYATECVVDRAERRMELSEKVREVTEVLALGRWGLASFTLWPNAGQPTLGWPGVLGQVQFLLRQKARKAPLAVLDTASGNEPWTPGPHGQARYLLGAYESREALATATLDQPGSGYERIRRSHHEVMPWVTMLHLADLAWTLRRRPELAQEYGLGLADAAEGVIAASTALLACHQARFDRQRAEFPAWYSEPIPEPHLLPLSTWELRDLFPALQQLLITYRDFMRRGAPDEYLGTENTDIVVYLVCDAWMASVHHSARAAAELSAEFAALDVLCTGDEQVDRVIAAFGEQPREADRQVPWWDDLTWRAWLRAAAAEVMRRADVAEVMRRADVRLDS